MTNKSVVILLIVILVILVLLASIFYILYKQSISPTRKMCLTTGDRTDCYVVNVSNDQDRFKNKYTTVLVDPVFNADNQTPFNMIFTCKFNVDDLILSSVMLGAGKDRPHSLKLNKKKGEIQLQFYSTYRRLSFEIRPWLPSFKVIKIEFKPYTSKK